MMLPPPLGLANTFGLPRSYTVAPPRWFTSSLSLTRTVADAGAEIVNDVSLSTSSRSVEYRKS